MLDETRERKSGMRKRSTFRERARGPSEEQAAMYSAVWEREKYIFKETPTVR